MIGTELNKGTTPPADMIGAEAALALSVPEPLPDIVPVDPLVVSVPLKVPDPPAPGPPVLRRSDQPHLKRRSKNQPSK